MTVAHRVKSYSEFYNTIKAQLGKDLRGDHIGKGIHPNEIKIELDFADQYHDLEHELEDLSNEKYW